MKHLCFLPLYLQDTFELRFPDHQHHHRPQKIRPPSGKPRGFFLTNGEDGRQPLKAMILGSGFLLGPRIDVQGRALKLQGSKMGEIYDTISNKSKRFV